MTQNNVGKTRGERSNNHFRFKKEQIHTAVVVILIFFGSRRPLDIGEVSGRLSVDLKIGQVRRVNIRNAAGSI